MLHWSCRLWNCTTNTRVAASREPGATHHGPDHRCTDTITHRYTDTITHRYTEHLPTIARTRNVQWCLGPSALFQHRLLDVAFRHRMSWAMLAFLHRFADRVTVALTHGITIVVSYINTDVSAHIISIISAHIIAVISAVISAFISANIDPIISPLLSTVINTNNLTSVTADFSTIPVADFVPDPRAADSVANTHCFARRGNNNISTLTDRRTDDDDGISCSSHGIVYPSAHSRVELAPHCCSD